MPYRRNNYDFVIDSSFTPFTMQEMLVPFMAYKDAFEKSEEAYTDLTTKADKFKYLAKNLDPNSEAAKIYNGYANDLKAQAEDLANNGLSMGNRSALTNLKRRYQGEIGRLVDADTELKKERELRRQMSAKDPSMLWAADNLTIDNYLDGNTPNLYGISGTELYTKAAAASQAASKRQFSVNGESKTLGGYYYDYVQKMGYNPDTIAKFRSDMSAIPELRQAAKDILKANGVTDNLTGRALEQAEQQVINGMIDGAVYSEQHNLQRDLGTPTWAEKDASDRGWASERRADKQMELSALASGYKRENGRWVLDEEGIKKRAELMGIDSYNPDDWELGPDGKPRRKKGTSAAKTPEEAAEDAVRKKELEKKMTRIQNLKGAHTIGEAAKQNFVPIFATIRPSHGRPKYKDSKELQDALIEIAAMNPKDAKGLNVNGWRSGRKGDDVEDLAFNFTDAPLTSGWFNAPWSMGDFDYSDDTRGRILSDAEYNALPADVKTSITMEMKRQGYDLEDPNMYAAIMEVRKGNHKGYVTLVENENLIP